MHKQLIIFDFDGTLINSVPDLAQALNATLNTLQLPQVEISRVEAWIGNGMPKLVERALDYVEADASLQAKAQQLCLANYEDCFCDKTYLYPHTIELLSALKAQGKLLALATNKPSQFVQPMLESLNIAEYFSLSLGGDDVAHKKPHPEMLHRCMNEFDIAPDATLMVGDSQNDIKSARNAGIEVAAVTYGYNHGHPVSDDNPDYLIDSLADLLTCGALT